MADPAKNHSAAGAALCSLPPVAAGPRLGESPVDCGYRQPNNQSKKPKGTSKKQQYPPENAVFPVLIIHEGRLTFFFKVNCRFSVAEFETKCSQPNPTVSAGGQPGRFG